MKKILIILAIIAVAFLIVNKAHAAVQLCDQESISDCITVDPTDTVTPTPTDPTPTSCVIWEGEFPIPCPTDTPVVTPTDQPNTGSQGGDGRGDGLGCGSHDCSVHVVVPLGAPATGHGA